MKHQSQTLFDHSSCSSTALPSTEKEQKATGIPRTVRHLLLSMLACLCLPKPERDNSLTCSMRMGSAYHKRQSPRNLSPVRRSSCSPVRGRWSRLSTSLESPTSITAQTSFHGTSVSIFQHTSPKYAGEERELLKLSEVKVKKVPKLPETYANVHPAYISGNPNPPPVICQYFPAPESTSHT